MNEDSPTLDQICFVISPIGREGSELHQQFREVLDFVIKPAVESAGYGLEVIRADDIERSGSFIKDILEYIAGSFVVIADLSQQNPNVFYELGVRHSLSPRTILIAQSLEDIPSDLREYRTIIYSTSAKGAALFAERMEKYLREMREDLQRLDNPVLDRLGGITEERTRELEAEVARLKSQLDTVLRTGSPPMQPFAKVQPVRRRLDRVLRLINARRQRSGTFIRHKGNDELYVTDYARSIGGDAQWLRVPHEEGGFQLYFVCDGGRIVDFFYISVPNGEVNFENELADVRVLMEECSKSNIECTFAIVADKDLNEYKEPIGQAFDEMKTFLKPQYRDGFHLELWDQDALLQKETDLGIRVEFPSVD